MADATLEDKLREKDGNEQEKGELLRQLFPDTVPLNYSVPNAVYEKRREIDYEPSYRNVTDMKNLPLFFDHESADFPSGLYGTYVPLTDITTIANHTKQDIEQRMRTKIHEYMLHRNAKLPDGYVLRALEALIAGEREKPRYRR